jgi:glucokinase
MSKGGYAIGIDLGCSTLKAVTVKPSGETLGRVQIEWELAASPGCAEQVRALVAQLQGEQKHPASAVGLATPGLAAADGHSIAHLPGRLQGLEGLDWARFLRTRSAVPVLNQAHAALIGEAWLGAARRFQNVLLLTLEAGVGGAAIVDGRLLQGQVGRAGHVGHLSLDPDGPPDGVRTPGSLELAIGNCTIQERSRGRFATTPELVAAYSAGDPEATVVWLRSIKALAAALCSLINILDPAAVILSGGIAQAGDALFEPLRQFLEPMEWRPAGHQVKLLPAQLGEYAGAYGAAAATLYGGWSPSRLAAALG